MRDCDDNLRVFTGLLSKQHKTSDGRKRDLTNRMQFVNSNAHHADPSVSLAFKLNPDRFAFGVFYFVY